MTTRRQLLVVLICTFLLALTQFPVFAYATTETIDRIHSLEAEINELQAKLLSYRDNHSEAVARLQLVESEILGCYARIETAERQVQSALGSLNSSIRTMYVNGNYNGMIRLLTADNTSDFFTRYDYMLEFARAKADDYKRLRETRGRLQSERERLLSRKEEQARLISEIETSGLEAELQARKNELADLQASLILSQRLTNGTNVNFSPGRVFHEPDPASFAGTGEVFSGYSSWYGTKFHGRSTSSGEVYDQFGFTCAHRTLPFGTWLKVTFRGNSVIVKVNDRGPFVAGRILDLSRGAADAIGMTGTGVGWVQCEIVVPR